ncbi:hypothetical protein RC74_18705 [Falsihalocynthiibacter arcticus]|uniref:LysR substrate-binding domain-containing protein n=2 Tax=Falsihalocynthiibacter arcticus TaxID=1579316 RepID=A0A126V4E1_9RHOB|nr:hypothetical protein RC74_18705 [Falsihalocynthiibacter arcticus]
MTALGALLLALTDAGVLVQDAAQDMLRKIHQLQRELGSIETVAKTLIFASTQALSFTFFPEWFSRTGGGVGVHLLADNMEACEQIMQEGSAHFLLCHTHPAAEMTINGDRFRRRTIATDQPLPVAAPDVYGTTLLHTSKADIQLLSFDERSGLGRILSAGLGEKLARLNLRPVFTSHVAMALRTMAIEGKGIAWLPMRLVSEDIAAGKLMPLEGTEWLLDLLITLIRPQARLSPLAEGFWSSLGHV